MGICALNTCCNNLEKTQTCVNFHFIEEDYNYTTRSEKLYLNNGKSIDNNQLLLSRKYFIIINELKQNPTEYIIQSKSHNLFDIFLKLKTSVPFIFLENNKLDIISYLMVCQEQTSIIEKEKEIKSKLNNGNINNLCLMQYITICNDVKENVWYFLEENEDDIDKILTVNYEYVMIICLTTETDKLNIYFIFYNEIN